MLLAAHTADVVSSLLTSAQPRRADRSGPVKGPTPPGAHLVPSSQPPVLYFRADLPCSAPVGSAAFRPPTASCSLDRCPTDPQVKQIHLARARSTASDLTNLRGGRCAPPSSRPPMPPDVSPSFAEVSCASRTRRQRCYTASSPILGHRASAASAPPEYFRPVRPASDHFRSVLPHKGVPGFRPGEYLSADRAPSTAAASPFGVTRLFHAPPQ